MKKTTKLFSLIALLTILDLLSKYFFYDQKLLANTQFLEPAFNTGIARSIPIPTLIIFIISALILILIIYLYYKKYINLRPCILLTSGNLGNIIDRIMLSGVRDFLVPFDRYPIFNLADIFISVGVVLVMINVLFVILEE